MVESSLIVIPARYLSKRLPGKIIADIHGKPMIIWVAERVMSAGIAPLVVATDSTEVLDVCAKFNVPAVLTSESCKNGTERVYEVSLLYPDTAYFINVQGDEPLLNTQILHDMLRSGMDTFSFKTAISRMSRTQGNNSSEVKVALGHNDRIRYASRACIPYGRDSRIEKYKIHGVYMYSRSVLSAFVGAPVGPLEIAESVEQLRCIESDIPLVGVLTHGSERSVDTQEDLDYMRNIPINSWLQRNPFKS